MNVLKYFLRLKETKNKFFKTKYLIFDFDGVLGDTDASKTEVTKEMEGKTEEAIKTATDALP